MATFVELLKKTLQTGVIQIKNYDLSNNKNTKDGERLNRYSIPFVDRYMAAIFKLYKSDYKKVRNGIFEFIKDDSVGLDREIEPQDPIEITKVQFISALFFISRNKNINSDWYDNKLENEKEQIFDQLIDHCKAEYPNFIAQVTNKQDKDDKLPEIIIK